MIYSLKKDIVFVRGACRGAIYNFDNGKVYSLSERATSSVYKLCINDCLTDSDRTIIDNILKYLNIINIRPTKYIQRKRPKSLKFAWLEITQVCNYRCLHCYEGNVHCEPQSALTEADWISVLDQLENCGCEGVQFIGGEPTTVLYLSTLIKHAHKIGLKNIEIFSNLSKLSNDLLETIIQNKVTVKFSIYGSNPEVHDKITQNHNSFNTLIANVQKMKKLGVPLKGNIVIMKENEHDFENIKRLLDDMEIRNRHYDEIRKVPGSIQSPHLPENEHLLFTKPNFSISKEKFERAFEGNTCWNGKFAVSTDGKVLPCVFERNVSYGNVKYQQIEDILSNRVLNEYWSLTFDFIDQCNCCEYRFACFDCRPLAYSANNERFSKNPRCKYNPDIGLWE